MTEQRRVRERARERKESDVKKRPEGKQKEIIRNMKSSRNKRL